MSPSQYGGYDPRLVTEWVRVRIPIKGKRSIGCLVDIPLEWYERTPNDAQQAESVVLWIVVWLRDLSLSCAQSACHHEQWCNKGGAIGPVSPSFPPASSDDRSASQLVAWFCPTRGPISLKDNSQSL
ncbi:hypothetical protein TNCV_4009791 [Trichonephila clavipes]|nr:hypothetical protein TNCV_4009791 [Trichonephila clavipes]